MFLKVILYVAESFFNGHEVGAIRGQKKNKNTGSVKEVNNLLHVIKSRSGQEC